MKFAKHFFTFLILSGVPTSAAAEDFANFDCGAGDMHYAVTMTELFAPFVTVKIYVGEQINQSLNRIFALNRTDKTSGAAMAFSRTDRIDGLVTFSASSPETVKLTIAGDTSLSCVNSNSVDKSANSNGQDINGMADMQERMKRPSDINKLIPLDTVGYSLGGKMRSQPSKNFNSIAKSGGGIA